MQYNFDEIVNRENTSSLKYDLRERIFGHGSVLPMWVADMDFKTPPFVIEALSKRLEHEILGYTFTPASVYKSVADWISRRHGWNVDTNWISFAPGVVPALNMLVMTYTQPGDKVIIQPPVYHPFYTAVENHGRELVFNPLRLDGDRYRMDLDHLRSVIDERTRMLILCNPHNPTGNVWNVPELLELAEICLARDVLLISDEIHADLTFPGNRHIPVATLSPEIAKNTITCMAPSKTFNLAGLSTSYLIIPDKKRKAEYDKTLDHLHIGMGNLFGFIAMEAAYNLGDEWLDQLMVYLQGNLDMMEAFINRHMPSIRIIRPQATYLVWLDCRELGLSPRELKTFMISKAGLGFNDGPQFGKEGEGFQRVNIACPRTTLLMALQKLQLALENYFEK